jgi:hypothetical protein
MESGDPAADLIAAGTSPAETVGTNPTSTAKEPNDMPSTTDTLGYIPCLKPVPGVTGGKCLRYKGHKEAPLPKGEHRVTLMRVITEEEAAKRAEGKAKNAERKAEREAKKATAALLKESDTYFANEEARKERDETNAEVVKEATTPKPKRGTPPQTMGVKVERVPGTQAAAAPAAGIAKA